MSRPGRVVAAQSVTVDFAVLRPNQAWRAPGQPMRDITPTDMAQPGRIGDTSSDRSGTSDCFCIITRDWIGSSHPIHLAAFQSLFETPNFMACKTRRCWQASKRVICRISHHAQCCALDVGWHAWNWGWL